MAILSNPIILRLVSRLVCQEEASLFPSTEPAPLFLVKGTNSPPDVQTGCSSWSGPDGWLFQWRAGTDERGRLAAPPQPAAEPGEHPRPCPYNTPCPRDFFVHESGHHDSACTSLNRKIMSIKVPPQVFSTLKWLASYDLGMS